MKRNGLIRMAMVLFMGFALSICVFTPGFAQKTAKPIELSFAHVVPSTVPFAKTYQEWGNRIAERSGGRVKINFYWVESLLKSTEMYRGVQTGTADIGFYPFGHDQGLMPLTEIFLMPFLGYPSQKAATEIYKKLKDKFPAIRDEFQGVKAVATEFLPGHHLNFTDRTIRVPAEIKGLKVAVMGLSMVEGMSALGAVPIEMGAGDYYVSVDRGLIRGVINHLPLLHSFGLLPVLKHHTLFGAGIAMAPSFVIMAPRTWQRLPADIQQIIEEAGLWLEQSLFVSDAGYEAMVMGKMKEMGHTITMATPEEIKLWQKAVQPVHDKMIAEREAKGLPARAIYKDLKQLISEYSK